MRIFKYSQYDLTGEKFDFVTVVKQVESVTGRHFKRRCWLVKCDCGVETIKNAKYLLQKTDIPKSCGCKSHRRRTGLIYNIKEPKINPALRKLIKCNYLKGAVQRNLIVELTTQDFEKLFSDVCYYCKVPPSKTIFEGEHKQYKFVYNGIDRLDNAVGYTVANSVSCCTNCNVAKQTQTVAEFKEWVIRLYSNFIQKTTHV